MPAARASCSTLPTAPRSTRPSPPSCRQRGGLHVLVNNAGITRDMLSMRLKDEDWDAVLDTNLKAVFRASRAAIKPMMKQRWGRIVNITSVVGAAGNPGQANYAAAKAGVAGMTRAMARELGSRNITVNCVAPGFIDTDMTRELPEAAKAALLAGIPLGRLGTAEEVAHAVAFLASPRAAYITRHRTACQRRHVHELRASPQATIPVRSPPVESRAVFLFHSRRSHERY